MSSNASISYITIFPNGPLLSRRYIKDLDDNPLKPADVASVTLNVYRRVQGLTAMYTREAVDNWSNVALTVEEVVFPAINDANGNPYNFQYCVEGAFAESNQIYIVEYKITLNDGHTVQIVVQATTTN